MDTAKDLEIKIGSDLKFLIDLFEANIEFNKVYTAVRTRYREVIDDCIEPILDGETARKYSTKRGSNISSLIAMVRELDKHDETKNPTN